jgi:hypothetical protein
MSALTSEQIARAALGGPTKRAGAELLWHSPNHEDRHESLSVNPKKNVFLCAPCGASGTAWQLAAFFARLDPGDKPGVTAWLSARGLLNDKKSAKEASARGPCVAQYVYSDAGGNPVACKLRFEPGANGRKKDFSWQRWENGAWVDGLTGVKTSLYRLPQIVAEPFVLLTEGEKDADAGAALGLPTTTSGGTGTFRPEHAEILRDKSVVILADADAPGRNHAYRVAASLAGKVKSVKVIELPGAKDLSAWLERGGTHEALLDLIHAAPEWTARSVDTAPMLDDLFTFIRRFVSLSLSQARVVALWVAHTHVIDAADATPYLAITSAEKQSGKTRLLEVGDLLVANPWLTGKVSAAVLIRKIDSEQPTLLLDESDAAFAGEKEYAEALRGVLNTGHRRGGKASCCVGQGTAITFKDFSTFSPKAIAGIGNLPDTISDRSVPIRLKRAARGEHVERFRRRDVEAEASSLRGRLEAWSLVTVENLRTARPILPDALTDRQQDGAEPLLAIADLAEGEWPESARRALVELSGEAQSVDGSIGVRLLADIRGVFQDRDVDRMPSAELAAALAEIETSPWGEWGKSGKPLSAAKLARLLARFVIVPHSVRVDDKTPKGYELDDFRDAFERYLPNTDTPSSPQSSFKSATTQQANTGTVFGDFPKCNTESLLRCEKSEIANRTGACCVVALPNPPAGAGEEQACSRKVWVGPPPKPVLCAICGQIQPSAVVLARHLDSCKSRESGEPLISSQRT